MSLREELDAIDEQMRVLSARKAKIYEASLAAPADEKVERDTFSRMLAEHAREAAEKARQPLVVHEIVWDEKNDALLTSRKNVNFVAVRIAGEKETHLGLYIGDLALGASIMFHKSSGVLTLGMGFHNPAIYVPKLQRIVFGCESWWGAIKSEADLKQITDADIDNLWYVKALKSLDESGPP